MNCPRQENCPFYYDKLAMGSGLSGIFKKKYCMGNHASCARFMVMEALGPEHVPPTLYPGMIDVALGLIASAGKSSSE